MEKAPLIHRYFHDYVQKKAMRNMILDEGKRLDGRRTDEIRPIWCETDYLPAAHGSGLFTRGETQALATVTLGTKMDEKVKDEVLVQGTEQFVLHYNFPPFSTGEAKAARGLSRREIGHGHLAWRALKPMIPLGEENPYAVRVVSDILESNGSSSMATVCAGTLALMDAGVKLRKPVSGIAMGLISDSESGKWAVLSDILGDEDHLGDMDFKVTGTRDGITATQMDIKVDGLSYEVLAAALEQARKGRLHILDILTDCIAAPRADYKPFVPRLVQIHIPKDSIGAVIGPGGKVIQDIQKTTNTTITTTSFPRWCSALTGSWTEKASTPSSPACPKTWTAPRGRSSSPAKRSILTWWVTKSAGAGLRKASPAHASSSSAGSSTRRACRTVSGHSCSPHRSVPAPKKQGLPESLHAGGRCPDSSTGTVLETGQKKFVIFSLFA